MEHAVLENILNPLVTPFQIRLLNIVERLVEHVDDMSDGVT
jgi:hypothetical protein